MSATAQSARTPDSPSARIVPALADVVSWGYAVAIILVVLNSDRYFSVFEGVLFMSLFVMLRALARQVRREATATPALPSR